jgi:cytosine/adenosine deaminase-related metal-dependent hydrolase
MTPPSITLPDVEDRPRPQLLRAQWVAPMDRPPVRDGAVVIYRNTIMELGDAAVLAAAYGRTADHHDLGDVVLLPGLINAHVHLELSDTPRPGDRWDEPLADWLIEVMKTAPRDGDAERIGRSVDIGVRQCFRFGVTTVGDITRQPAITRRLLKASPLRVHSFGEVQAMAGRRHLLAPRLAAAADRTHESDRLRVGISPHAPYSIEPHGYRQCVEAARDGGMVLATHIAESPDEPEFMLHHTGPLRRIWDFLGNWTDSGVSRIETTPVRHLWQHGLLDVPAVLVHVNYCSDDDLSVLAGRRASVAYCPRTHAYFRHPPHRWRDMQWVGVNVVLGTDSLASSPDLNLVDDVRLVRKLAPDVPARDLWAMVTTRAARALEMFENVGSIRQGKEADLVAFPVSRDTDDPLEVVLREHVLPKAVWVAGERVGDDLR